jgi:hypothetical protein
MISLKTVWKVMQLACAHAGQLLAQSDDLLHDQICLQGIFLLLGSLLIVSLPGFTRAVRTNSACRLADTVYLTPGRFGTRLFSDLNLGLFFRYGNHGFQGHIFEL